MSRTNLVLHFVCSRCGRLLEFDTDKTPTGIHDGLQNPPLPTGADNLNPGVVRVKPCRGCIEPLKNHAMRVTNGLAALAALGDKP